MSVSRASRLDAPPCLPAVGRWAGRKPDSINVFTSPGRSTLWVGSFTAETKYLESDLAVPQTRLPIRLKTRRAGVCRRPHGSGRQPWLRRRCEKIKIPTKICPGPQGWFSWRTLGPNLFQRNSNDPMAVNSCADCREGLPNL